MAAIEGRWNDEKPAGEVLIGWPEAESRRNLYAITLPPPFGSLIDADSFTAGNRTQQHPRENWPPLIIHSLAFGLWWDAA